MKAMFDFHCRDCGDTFEMFTDERNRTAQCDCGGKAHRMISKPGIRLDGTSGDFPTAYDRWASVREANARIKARRN